MSRRASEADVPLVLCADDFGLRAGVDTAILRLVGRGVVTATSCLVHGPSFATNAAALAHHGARVDLGLHLALTDVPPAGPMPRLLGTVRAHSFASLVSRLAASALAPAPLVAELTHEFERQYDAFVRAFGRPPDFVDGHQYVHQLPIVREALFAMLARRPLAPGGFLRLPYERPCAVVARRTDVLRALAIGLPAAALVARATRLGIATNAGFAGIRRFGRSPSYPRRFARFVEAARPGVVVVCHPGERERDDERADPIAAARAEELAFFVSSDFDAIRRGARVRFVRFAEIHRPSRDAHALADDGHSA